ncbi:MAG: lipopolysaccharide biosynthesis protein [Candidatus Methylumidiphilus sp.]
MSKRSVNFRKSFIIGTSWMIGLRWAIKGIGLINTAVLARLLTPEDFGLIALSSLVVGFTEIWLAFGVDLALIQKKNTDQHDYNTAWSFRLVQGILVSLILLLISPIATEYFHEPRVLGLINIMALCTLLSGATNIGIVDFRKELNFERECIYSIISRLVSFFLTIGLACWLRNYWAMVVGIVANQVVSWILSYSMHPYRPRLTFSRFDTIWNFSKWMLLVNIGIYISQKLDEFIVARTNSSANFGIYNVASDLGQIPTNELSFPISRVLVPLLAKLQEEPDRMWGSYLKVMAGVNTFTLPAGIGMALLAPQLVPIILGYKWLEAIPYVQILSMYGSIRFIFGGVYNVLTAQGKTRAFAAMLWLEISAILAFGIPGALYFGLLGVAYSRLIATSFTGMTALAILFLYGRITPSRFFSHIIRPGLACLVMAEVLWGWPTDHIGVPLLDLLASTALGAATYTVVLLSIWWGIGKPDGVERIVICGISEKFKGLAKN